MKTRGVELIFFLIRIKRSREMEVSSRFLGLGSFEVGEERGICFFDLNLIKFKEWFVTNIEVFFVVVFRKMKDSLVLKDIRREVALLGAFKFKNIVCFLSIMRWTILKTIVETENIFIWKHRNSEISTTMYEDCLCLLIRNAQLSPRPI